MSHGKMAMVVFSTERLATRASTNSTMPIGGCNKPIIRFSTMISPKCTGSIPSCCTTGMSTGTRMVIAATGSRKHPTNSISKLASSRNTHGLCVKANTHKATASVTLVAVNSQPKIDAAATMNNTTAVVSMVSIDTLTSIFHVMVRYQTSPRNSAQTQAAIAPSVGVNTPVVMPPINSTGVMIGITASNFHFQSAASKPASPSPKAMLNGIEAATSPHISTGNPMTTASSTDALPRRVQSNTTSPPQWYLCAKYATVSIIKIAITTPGTMPATKSWPTETLAIIP